MLARIDARTLVVRVPVLVVLLLPLWYVARTPLAAALAPPAERVLGLTLREGIAGVMADGTRILFAWSRPEDLAAIEEYGVPWRPAPGQAIHINLVVFLALALATPQLGWRQRLTVLAVGLPLLYAADVLTLVAALRWQLVKDFGYLGPEATGDRWVDVTYYWPHLFLISVGNQAFGVGAWLAGLAVALRPRRPPAVTRAVGRNAPCPCGSGRKHKHCCGATA